MATAGDPVVRDVIRGCQVFSGSRAGDGASVRKTLGDEPGRAGSPEVTLPAWRREFSGGPARSQLSTPQASFLVGFPDQEQPVSQAPRG